MRRFRVVRICFFSVPDEKWRLPSTRTRRTMGGADSREACGEAVAARAAGLAVLSGQRRPARRAKRSATRATERDGMGRRETRANANETDSYQRSESENTQRGPDVIPLRRDLGGRRAANEKKTDRGRGRRALRTGEKRLSGNSASTGSPFCTGDPRPILLGPLFECVVRFRTHVRNEKAHRVERLPRLIVDLVV